MTEAQVDRHYQEQAADRSAEKVDHVETERDFPVHLIAAVKYAQTVLPTKDLPCQSNLKNNAQHEKILPDIFAENSFHYQYMEYKNLTDE